MTTKTKLSAAHANFHGLEKDAILVSSQVILQNVIFIKKNKLGKAQNVFKEKIIVIFENKLWYYHSKTLGI